MKNAWIFTVSGISPSLQLKKNNNNFNVYIYLEVN